MLDPTPHGFWEGCLSVPGLRGYVERPRKIKVDYLDRAGEPRSLVVEDFLATVFQHELDHLDGTLSVDKITSPERCAFTEEYQRYHMQEGELAAED